MFTVDELHKRKIAERKLDPTGHGMEHRGTYKKQPTVFNKQHRLRFGMGSPSSVVEKEAPIDELRKYLSYDPDAGVINRIRRLCENSGAVSARFTVVNPEVKQRGRRSTIAYVEVGDVAISASHCAWYLLTGCWEPNVYLVDGVPRNLKASNLTLTKPEGYGKRVRHTDENNFMFPEYEVPCA